MEILYFLSAICLLLFMVLATYDGFYLHLFKYELFNHKESYLEHKIHTVRAVLFPIIVWFLFIENSTIAFWIGGIAVLLDLVVLGIDAYTEKESRTFMGGLPRWEYILHLFANSFHFAAIILIIASKLIIINHKLVFIQELKTLASEEFIYKIAINIIPGAIILALVHILLSFPIGKIYWNQLRRKIICC